MRASVRAVPLLLSLVAAACAGGATVPSTGGSKPKAPHRFFFSIQPSSIEESKPFTPSIRVEVRDVDGKLVSSATPTITLRLTVPANGKARLLGQTAVAASAGVAVFQGLSVDKAGSPYALDAAAEGFVGASSQKFSVSLPKRHLIVLIGDGLGYKQIEAANRYTKSTPAHQSWTRYAMTTWDDDTLDRNNGLGYDPGRAWSDLSYLTNAATDSASSATAMFTGQKTSTGNVAVSTHDVARLTTIHELAKARGIASGAVSTVPISHATPAAWAAHNSARENTYAIADELLFGHPNTTGDPTKNPLWGGHWGATLPGLDVLIGGGHPSWLADVYVTTDMAKKVRTESGRPGRWTLVERIASQADGGARLLATARNEEVDRLFGLWGGTSGNIEFRLANGTGHDKENPTLPEMTRAALAVLERKANGFALVVEGGAIDWAGHGNQLDECIGEVIDFDRAVAAVIAWVDDPSNASDWSNTLVLVTGDHETGLLTAGPDVFPNEPLGEVSDRTLALEKPYGAGGNRASWEDLDNNGEIGQGEPVYWVWQSWGHSNTLIPLFVRGDGAGELAKHVVGTDPVRGRYVDNTAILSAMLRALRLP